MKKNNNLRNNLKKEGHTHTEFCPHGSKENVELMIQKAIRLGFQEYSITEHAPLPPNFKNDYEGTRTGLTEASMGEKDVVAYLDKCKKMQRKYKNQIKINIGFEIDFFPQYINWTRHFLNKYKKITTDNILSVHFMRGKNNKFWAVDDELKDFKIGLLDYFKNTQELYKYYLFYLLQAVQALKGPLRIGHLTLVKKFQDYFGLSHGLDDENQKLMRRLLALIKKEKFELDFNASGLYKPFCNETYPDLRTIILARKMKIPLVYGSDAHSVQEVGHGYHCLHDLIEN